MSRNYAFKRAVVALLPLLFVVSNSYSSDISRMFLEKITHSLNSKSASIKNEELALQPIPAGEELLTWAKYYQKMLEWSKEKYVKDYMEYGTHSPEWDEKAKQILIEYAAYVIGGKTKESLDSLKPLSIALMKLKCTDPFANYIHGSVLIKTDKYAKAVPFFEKSLALYEKSQYPQMYWYHAVTKLRICYKKVPRLKSKLNPLLQKKITYIAQAAGDKDYLDGNQRYYIREVFGMWHGYFYNLDNLTLLMLEIENNENIDPWIKLIVKGRSHLSTVSCITTGKYEGGATYAAEMAAARKCFEEAYKMHPEFPEAAVMMIEASGDKRVWFDRAVAAHFDLGRPYYKMIWFLRPRWGGSHQEMYKFGLECLNTGRFDTYVPHQFYEMLDKLSDELDDRREAYTSPGVYEDLKRYYEGMLAESESTRYNKVSDVSIKSQYAAMAWWTGHYEDAQRLFDELGAKLENSAFSELECSKKDAVAETTLMCGPSGDEFERAEKRFNQGQSLEALPLYEELRNKLKGDKGLSLIEDRLAVLRMKRQFLDGGWVDVMPDNTLAGWSAVDGEWSLLNKGDGPLQGFTTKTEKQMFLLNKFIIEGNYEFRGETDAPYMAGIVLGYNNVSFTSLTLNKYKKQVEITRVFARAYKAMKTDALRTKNRFLVRVHNGNLTVHVNDKPFFVDEPILKSWWNPYKGQIGLGEYYGSGHKIKYSNLQIRSIKEQENITYDVSSTTTNAVTVSLVVSNGAAAVSTSSVTGDVSVGVPTGVGKSMVLDMAEDRSGNVEELMIGVVASDSVGGGAVPPGMVVIPVGINGGTDPDYGYYALTNATSLYMDATEVTKAQWDAVYTWAITNEYRFDNAGSSKAADHPVHSVNWYDCAKWCNARSEKEGRSPCYTVSGSVYKTGHSSPDCNFGPNSYRLPTNTEWVYAARGGLSGKRFPSGDTVTHIEENYYSNSSFRYDVGSTRGYHPAYDDGGTPYTSPAGAFAANGYGLYDMAGNIWEWCNDTSGTSRHFRGGSWDDYAYKLCCGRESWIKSSYASDTIGFRTVCR